MNGLGNFTFHKSNSFLSGGKGSVDNSFFLNSTVCFPPVSGGGMIAVLKTAVEIGQGGKACFHGNFQNGKLCAVKELAGFL